jgi:hypothetical protein
MGLSMSGREAVMIKIMMATLIAVFTIFCNAYITFAGEPETYRVIVPPAYDYGIRFYGYCTVVYKDGKQGLIDTDGNVVVPVIYDDINGVFYEGLAAARSGDKWGYVDTAGNVAIPFIYENAEGFYIDGKAPVTLNGKTGLIDTKGHVVVPLIYDYVFSINKDGLAGVQIDDKHGIVDLEGNIILPIIYDGLSGFSDDGLMIARYNDKDGMMDKDFNLVIPHEYDYLGAFYDGMVQFSCLNDYALDRHGWINLERGVVIPPIFSSISSPTFDKGLVWVAVGEGFDGQLWGAIDKKGNLVVPFIYKGAYDADIPGRDITQVSILNGDKYLHGYVDSEGNVILPPQHDRLIPLTSDKTLTVGGATYDEFGNITDAVYGIADMEGNSAFIPYGIEILPLAGLDPDSEGLIPAVNDGLLGYYNLDGELAIPFQYYNTEYTISNEYLITPYMFWGGVSVVLDKDGRYGVIDTAGNTVVPFKYEEIRSFEHDITPARLDGKWGIIDKAGNELVPFIYDEIQVQHDNGDLATVCLDGKWGAIEFISVAD